MTRRSTGYAVLSGPDGVAERDTLTCGHDQRVIFVKVDPAGWCLRCDRPVCSACEAKGRCTPFEERLEKEEARGRLLRSMGVG